MMPAAGSKIRAEQLSALEGTIHKLQTDKKIEDFLDDAYQTQSPSIRKKSNLREIKKLYDRSSKIPIKLSEALVYKTSLAQNVWWTAKKKNSFSLFKKILSEVVELKKSEADCIKNSSQNRYDALLNDFEPGITSSQLSSLFQILSEKLKELSVKVRDKKKYFVPLSDNFSRVNQLAISKDLAKSIGYNFNAGRLDESAHPFSSGSKTDSRITTRINQQDPLECIYSVLHEVGHALYEQGIPENLVLEPAGRWTSMGLHESQSRLFENQIGRSKGFTKFLNKKLRIYFPNIKYISDKHLFQAINSVKKTHIRTESDEIHYNLHIILRFQLEQKLLNDSLKVDDLEREWNSTFEQMFNFKVTNSSQGVLQDIHWSAGLFGYFPTYALGNIYSACLYSKIESLFRNLDEDFAEGNFANVVLWLNKNIHRHVRFKDTYSIIETATGSKIDSRPLLEYLNKKFSKIYNF